VYNGALGSIATQLKALEIQQDLIPRIVFSFSKSSLERALGKASDCLSTGN
jgi:hypothetical protein